MHVVPALLAAVVGTAAAPPLTISEHGIGAVRIGESRSAVEHRYGHARIANFSALYRVAGGSMRVAYDREDARAKVVGVGTDSSAFSLGSIRVGTPVPLRPCRRVKRGTVTGCRRRWRGFVYDSPQIAGRLAGSWYKHVAGGTWLVQLYPKRGRIDYIYVGYLL